MEVQLTQKRELLGRTGQKTKEIGPISVDHCEAPNGGKKRSGRLGENDHVQPGEHRLP